jgi:hypothetical protein
MAGFHGNTKVIINLWRLGRCARISEENEYGENLFAARSVRKVWNERGSWEQTVKLQNQMLDDMAEKLKKIK